MKRVMAVLTVTGTILLGLLAPAGPAQAKVPGPNGQLLFLRFDPAVGDTVLYTVNPDGSHPHQVLPSVVECAHWSPDGSRIATCGSPSGGATLIINPDTGSYLDMPMPDPDLLTFCWVWSSNGKRLACESFGQTDPSLNGIYTIRTSDGQGLTRVTSIAGGDDLPIDYSPNGKQIVFDRTDPNGPPGRNQALFVVNVNGSGLHRITPWGFSDDDGSWSPDATKIVFEHFGSLFAVHPDGTHLMKLPLQTGSATTAFTAFDPGWSPDGTRLVFSINTKTSDGATQEGIATANADGSDVQIVTTSPTRDHKADWGPHPLAT
jgi:Tol biopolymer transport system component